VLFRGPDLDITADGAEAAIASYADFMRNSAIHRCELGEPQIDLAGDTAVATTHWSMAFRREGQEFDQEGHEFVVLTRTEGLWEIRWRTLAVTRDGRRSPTGA
jgi:hypothetical protein